MGHPGDPGWDMGIQEEIPTHQPGLRAVPEAYGRNPAILKAATPDRSPGGSRRHPLVIHHPVSRTYRLE